jgi:Uma2 family endonuclease
MAQDTRLLTADELFEMRDDGFHRYELVDGRLLTMTPAGGLHGLVGGRLFSALFAYVDDHRLGVVMPADTGFKLESDPDTVRAPDVSFISRGRIPEEGVPRAFWLCAPDLAVEVLSPSDRRADVNSKIAQYLRLGVKVVWLVEPSPRRVTVFRPGEPPQVLGETDALDAGDLLPGFRYPLSRLFTADL